MYRHLFTILTLACFAVEGTDHCSSLKGIRLQLQTKAPKDVRERKIKTQATRLTLKVATTSSVRRAYYESTYCPPVELGLVKDCKKHSVVISNPFPQTNLEGNRQSDFCMLPEVCDEIPCDALEEGSCFYPSMSMKYPINTVRRGKLSSSWVHHRCARGAFCEGVEGMEEYSLFNSTHIVVEHPVLGRCVAPYNSTTCCWQNGFCIQFKGQLEEEGTVKIICMDDGKVTTCLDPELGSMIMMSGGIGHSRNSLYKDISHFQEIQKSRWANNLVDVPDVETVEEIYESLEFESLQSNLNNHLLERRLSFVENFLGLSLDKSIDPISLLFWNEHKIILKFHKRDGNNTLYYICPSHQSEDPIYPNQIQWETFDLFDFESTSHFTVPRPQVTGYQLHNQRPPLSYFSDGLEHGSADIVSTRMGFLDFLGNSWQLRVTFVSNIVMWLVMMCRRR